MSTLAMRALMNEVKQRRGARLFDLPASGQISASDINVELGRAFNAEFNINGAEERFLAGIPSGVISFSDFHGKSSLTHRMVVGNLATNWGYDTQSIFGSLDPLTMETTLGQSNVSAFTISEGNESFLVATDNMGSIGASATITVTVNDVSYILLWNGSLYAGVAGDAAAGLIYFQANLGIEISVSMVMTAI